MNLFTRQLRMVLLLAVVAAAAVCWFGCGGGDSGTNSGGNNNGGGGGGNSLVGDWMVYSDNYYSVDGWEDVLYYGEEEALTWILSFRSSGEAADWGFIKVGNVWVEMSSIEGKWRTNGQKLYIGEEWVTYSISDNKLILTEPDEEEEGSWWETTFIKVNVADIRKNLGMVYMVDSRLYKSTVYDDLIWYMQSNEDYYIEFGSTSVWGDGLERYVDYSDPSYYINGNKIVLVEEDCDWDYNDVRHCTVLSTDELTYSIAGSGKAMRLTINGDTWLPAEYDEYMDSHRNYYYSPAKSKQPRRVRSPLSGLFVGR